MKGIFSIALMIVCFAVQGQTYIQPRNLQVSDNRTTNLVFPAPIFSIDRGSDKIVVQKSADNILRVKADSFFSDTTNLTVITRDGKLYSFLVSFTFSPSFLNIDLSETDHLLNDTALYRLAGKVLALKTNLHGISYNSGGVRWNLNGIYSDGENIVCKLRIENHSAFSFATGGLRCYVGTSNNNKRRASQLKEISPLLISPTIMLIKEKQFVLMVIVLPKSALIDGQQLQIVQAEKEGDRQLVLKITNRQLLRAILIK